MTDQHGGSGIVARLEVLQSDGTDGWKDAGAIEIDCVTAHELESGSSGTTTASAAPTDHLSNNNDRDISTPPIGRKRLLPRRTKLLLSPNAKIKSDRRSNYLFRHSSDGVDTNLLVLLHGAGDSHAPFLELGKRMQLPQTSILSVHASSCGNGFVTLPFGLGHTWFEEMDYVSTGNVLSDSDSRRRDSLDAAADRMLKILQSLQPTSDDADDIGWIPERIFLFGYSAGACLVMETCSRMIYDEARPLGGAICIAGGIKGEHTKKPSASPLSFRGCTPILLVVGSDDANFPKRSAQRASVIYAECKNATLAKSTEASVQSAESVSIYEVKGKRHSMIKSEDEMKAIMEFFSKNLVRIMPTMEAGTTVKRA